MHHYGYYVEVRRGDTWIGYVTEKPKTEVYWYFAKGRALTGNPKVYKTKTLATKAATTTRQYLNRFGYEVYVTGPNK